MQSVALVLLKQKHNMQAKTVKSFTYQHKGASKVLINRNKQHLDKTCLFYYDLYMNKGSMPEWLKGMSCNLIGIRLRWFKSSSAHLNLVV
jgi:hypothetical protein